MSKYTVLGIITAILIFLPFILSFFGLETISEQDISQITSISNPHFTNAVSAPFQWIGFYFNALTLKIPGSGKILSLIVYVMIALEVLAIISVFRGD